MANARQRTGPGLNTLLRRINIRIRATQLILFAERLWPRLLPLFCVAALFAAFSWFGYFRLVPEWLRLATGGLFGLGALAALFPLTRPRWPSRQSALDRLERDNRIVHQAIAVQSDRLVSEDDVFAHSLWQAHKKRMAEQIDAVHLAAPRPDTPKVDPYGLRAVVALLFVVGFAYSYSSQSGLLSDVFHSHKQAQAVAGIRVDAWVTPPDYTGKAPIFLTGNTKGLPETIAVPQGSEMLVRIVGGNGSEEVVYESGGQTASVPVEEDAASEASSLTGNATTARNYRFEAPGDGTLLIRRGTQLAESWRFELIADTPPVIAFDGNPGRATNGALEIGFTLNDDYGVQRAYAEIVPAEPQAADARPLYDPPEYPLTLPRKTARERKGRESRNLTEHPMAGTPVRITLVAEDFIGQTGRSEAHEMILPGRFFHNLLAGSVAEQRQVLALDTNKVDRVFDLNDAITMAPEETIDNTTHYLLIKSARARLKQAWDDDMLRDTADYMWDIALGIEDGNLSFAERRLRDAQRALSEALENGASDEEIQALMDELREAMQEFLQALAQQMQQNQSAMQQIPPEALQNMLRQQDLDRMLDQIENLAQSGARDQAQQLLSELQRMMNNLQMGQHQQVQGDNPMRQQMDQLGELMQRQQQLMEQTFDLEQALRDRQQREFFQDNQRQQQDGQQSPQNGMQEMTEEELQQALRDLQEMQEQLQQQLGELQEKLEQFGLGENEGFDEAGEAMGEAGEALGEAEGGTAVDEQGRALQALRQGAQQMMNQMRQSMGQNPGNQPGTAQRDPLGTDPLGRPRANSGPDFGEDVKVPEEADIQRARRILEAIRERLGDAFRPEMERFYLERLLDSR
ncbi:TIGR02302 family protein [Hoeflea poritis]|uniref:TIGR02302 family protein n=1 Tax=Hoeflea poritis TaxID=2993659 RepID=A0ABT4VM62_9HYPH|nr:TIGR02302 family protein [Hoeflea poritis]MDA4845810.1 TIGR02302 family protein [Hoeflea poritis]